MGRVVNHRISRHHSVMSGGAALHGQIDEAVSSRAATVPFFHKKEVCNSEKCSFEEEKNTFFARNPLCVAAGLGTFAAK